MGEDGAEGTGKGWGVGGVTLSVRPLVAAAPIVDTYKGQGLGLVTLAELDQSVVGSLRSQTVGLAALADSGSLRSHAGSRFTAVKGSSTFSDSPGRTDERF